MDSSGAWAEKLRTIAKAVKAWEDRDVREQMERGDAQLSRPAFFADLEELAMSFEGKSNRFAASITARQNWLRTVSDFDRDWQIAALVHQHRTNSKSTVNKGKLEAAELPGTTEAIIDEADKRYRRYFIDGTAEFVRPFLRAKAARFPVRITRDGGKKPR
jgi:hypothetical protein